jgi:serine/threonine-protein kinase HipA
MYKAMGDRLPSEIDLILASGEHRVGALAFGPTPERPERITPWGDGPAPGEEFTLAELAEAAERAQHVDELDENLRALLAAGSSLGGARPKAATQIGDRPWIAKFQKRGDSFPECRVELATMQLASECGLNVPALDFRCVLDRDIYLIERFDRVPHGNWLERRPFASGLTMLGAHESEVSSYSYADLAGAIRQHGTQVRADLHELFRRMVFNILVTNDDDHLRNHGFLFDGTGWRLSPLYDVVPKPQVGLERRLVLGVGPEGRNATIGNALAGAAVFDLGPGEASTITEELRVMVAARWQPLFEKAGLSPADRGRFATCFRLAIEDG